jgi:hypothetical protein
MSVLQTQFQTSNVRHPRQAQFAGVSDAVELEHDPEMWKPVFRNDHAGKSFAKVGEL